MIAKKSERIASFLSLRERAGVGGIAVPRPRHGEIAIRFAVLLYAFAGISSHQVPKVLQLAGLLWNGITDNIPSHVTVLDWVKKCGLSITKGCMGKKTEEEAYSIIYDNSITVCGQDLHLELKSSSELPGHSLRHADVSVLRMKVGKGRDAEMINGQLENVYSKDPEFMDFIVKKGNARKFSHTPMAGLMPPRRREYARFMNVFDTVHRAKAILENDRLLSGHERYIHQTTTIPVRLRQPLHCLLSLFYIKPQRYRLQRRSDAIVFYLYSTSNHNYVEANDFDPEIVFYLYSTSNHNCRLELYSEAVIVFYLYSTSNHNYGWQLYLEGVIVFYLYSTSNHNHASSLL